MLVEKINQYISDKGFSQAAIARKAGMTKQAMSSSMRGARKLSAEEYVAICKALDVGIDFFADASAERPATA